MLRHKCGVVALHVARRLADNLVIPYDRVARLVIVKKSGFAHIVHVTVDTLDGLDDMLKVIRNTKNVRFAHSDIASPITRCRHFSGNALGVSTSTLIASRCFNST